MQNPIRRAKRLVSCVYPWSRKPAVCELHLATSQEIQTLLRQNWRALRHSGTPLPSFRDIGFRKFSEFEEDGILLFIFALIGEQSRRVVELCAGDGTTCMATNLILNHGWEGFLFDGKEKNVARGRKFFGQFEEIKLVRPTFTHAWLTAENVNGLLETAGSAGEVDLFSLDIDGNDYWIWKAIEAIRPRVCVFETHDIIPGDLALTIPYDPDFFAWDKQGPEKDFRSVSLKAMVELSREKGYRLIGAHRHGFNAFFMRDNVGTDFFPEVSIESIHDNPWTRRGQATRWPRVKDFPWQSLS